MLVLDIPGDRTGSAGLRGGITSVKNIAEVYIQPFKCMGENRSYTECTECESIQSQTIRNVGSDCLIGFDPLFVQSYTYLDRYIR